MSALPGLFDDAEVEALAKWREKNLTPAASPAAPAAVQRPRETSNPFTQKQVIEGKIRGYRVKASGKTWGDFGSKHDAFGEIRRQQILNPSWCGRVVAVLVTQSGLEAEAPVDADPPTAPRSCG